MDVELWIKAAKGFACAVTILAQGTTFLLNLRRWRRGRE